ncbi:hypothetical protein TNCV_3120041 [Trichonephila clavipes]|uniref:Uncharacterized protein n=1 Tax=Trichonephila clavipes TaxID=2585209 RepID=A0A8X7BHN6_TRICX|nr:hypothetical protein TNCV_3120041 [Trichonephila clavipes]
MELSFANYTYWLLVDNRKVNCNFLNMGFKTGATETSRNITARVIERDTSGEIYYILEDSEGSELANMVAKDAKMVTKVAKLAANFVAKNDANLALPPRFCQVLIESPL